MTTPERPADDHRGPPPRSPGHDGLGPGGDSPTRPRTTSTEPGGKPAGGLEQFCEENPESLRVAPAVRRETPRLPRALAIDGLLGRPA